MSTTKLPATRPRRPRTLQDDLLDDLRSAAPSPAARPTSDHPVPTPAERQASTDPEALTVELRLTPRSWSALSVRTPPIGTGLVVTAGPLHLHFRGPGAESIGTPGPHGRFAPLVPGRSLEVGRMVGSGLPAGTRPGGQPATGVVAALDACRGWGTSAAAGAGLMFALCRKTLSGSHTALSAA